MYASRQASRVRPLTWPLEFGLPSLCATISFFAIGSEERFSLNCLPRANSARCRSWVYGPRCASQAPVRLVAGLRRARLCCNGHRICLLLRVMLLFAARGVPEFLSVLFGVRLPTFWVLLPSCISDLRDWNKYFCIVSSWRIAAIIVIPLALAASAARQPPVPGRTISRWAESG